MGISVIPPPASANTAIAAIASSGSSQPLADSIQPIDFATLLIGQISSIQPSSVPLAETTILSEKMSDEGLPEIIRDLLTPQDPALNPQIALAYATPPVPSTLPAAPPTEEFTLLPGLAVLPPGAKGLDKESQTGKGDLAMPLPTDLKSAATQTPGTQLAASPSGAPALLTAQPREAAILAGESSNTAQPNFAATLSSQTSLAPQASATASPPAVTTPLQDSRWPQAFGDRVVWMAKNDQQQAQINITPPQMGPIQITLSINGDQASIAFASPHAEVRKAIEDALPNLREMLSTSGINLGQSDVGAEMKQQQQREMAGQVGNGQRFAGETAILPADGHLGLSQSGRPIQQGRGLVDLFA